METSAISYRVADFLKAHPPFQAVGEEALLQLAAHGRVRFCEANEYLLWQGEPHKSQVFVIQQGTVSLWDEAGREAVLKDVRGAGDMLGVERFTGAPYCLYSARSTSDVVIYAFPAPDFEALILSHPYARQFVEAYDSVTAAYAWTKDARDPQHVLLHDVAGGRTTITCDSQATIRDAARAMGDAGSEAMALVHAGRGLRGVVTIDALLTWIANGGGDVDRPVASLLRPAPAVAPGASAAEGVLALADAGAVALAITADGRPDGALHALVTSRDVGRAFGDQPVSILREIPRATSLSHLRELNYRARALALRFLTDAPSVAWLAPLLFRIDTAILTRIIALTGESSATACWCVCGAAGRAERLTRHAPTVVLIAADASDRPALDAQHGRVCEALAECGYLPGTDSPFDRAFHVADRDVWRARYEHWLRDPVRSQMYLARPLFDLRAVCGDRSLWQEIASTVAATVDRNFLFVLANDCLTSLPPLTFFQDAVVEESGEQTHVFRLEQSALQPLVDVGRVFGMAAGHVVGTSTDDRLTHARTLLPEHDAIFREASETLRILLWQQARIGIREHTTGSELPPALLSRHDRHVLKSGFRSILELVRLTGHSPWFDAV